MRATALIDWLAAALDERHLLLELSDVLLGLGEILFQRHDTRGEVGGHGLAPPFLKDAESEDIHQDEDGDYQGKQSIHWGFL
jgi:hypothetical protein